MRIKWEKMINFFKGIDSLIDFINRYMAIIGITGGASLAFINVVVRYVFDGSITWASELTVYLFLWSMFFGVAYCFKIEGHISINLFLETVSKKTAKFLIISTKIISFLFLLVIAYYGYEYVITLHEWGDTANDLDVGLWVPHLVIPISFGFAAYTLLLQIFKTITTPAEDLHFVSETEELMEEQNIQAVVDDAHKKSGGMM